MTAVRTILGATILVLVLVVIVQLLRAPPL
jgi:hypothetical protein